MREKGRKMRSGKNVEAEHKDLRAVLRIWGFVLSAMGSHWRL